MSVFDGTLRTRFSMGSPRTHHCHHSNFKCHHGVVQEYGGKNILVQLVKGKPVLGIKNANHLKLYLTGEVTLAKPEKTGFFLCNFLGTDFYVTGPSGRQMRAQCARTGLTGLTHPLFDIIPLGRKKHRADVSNTVKQPPTFGVLSLELPEDCASRSRPHRLRECA